MSRDVRITPSILNANRDDLRNEIAKIASASDLLHLDVMDDLFVPNFTFDFEASSKIIDECPIPVDAHLMVSEVDNVAAAYAEIGAASVTIHVEACENIRQTLRAIRSAGARAAIAVKRRTEIDLYADFFDEVDMVLVMTVEPGFGGQKFMKDMMDKVERTRSLIGDREIWLQVDGGISLDTIEIAHNAGADTFVAGSAVFSAQNPAVMVNKLRDKVATQ